VTSRMNDYGIVCLLIAGLSAMAGPFTARLAAQGATASILGTVTDTSGAAVPDWAVEARNSGTAQTQTVASNQAGRFILSDLAVGDYDVQASKTGFATVVSQRDYADGRIPERGRLLPPRGPAAADRHSAS